MSKGLLHLVGRGPGKTACGRTLDLSRLTADPRFVTCTRCVNTLRFQKAAGHA